MLALATVLFFAGHVVRDGWPSFHDLTNGRLGTQAARIAGAVLCGLGALAIAAPILALVISVGVLVGYFTDMKHGEAGGADTLRSLLFGLLSGVTSLVPLAALLALVTWDWRCALIVAVGFLKPAIWSGAWALLRGAQDTWFQPTRIAAGTFGAGIAVALAVLL